MLFHDKISDVSFYLHQAGMLKVKSHIQISIKNFKSVTQVRPVFNEEGCV